MGSNRLNDFPRTSIGCYLYRPHSVKSWNHLFSFAVQRFKFCKKQDAPLRGDVGYERLWQLLQPMQMSASVLCQEVKDTLEKCHQALNSAEAYTEESRFQDGDQESLRAQQKLWDQYERNGFLLEITFKIILTSFFGCPSYPSHTKITRPLRAFPLQTRHNHNSIITRNSPDQVLASTFRSYHWI